MMKKTVNGVLLLDKPTGISSNKALQQSRLYYQAKKAGHTGTLDPLATGLLPICFGEATKFASFALHGSKEYIATVSLGATSTTYDGEGIVTPIVNAPLVDETQFNSSCHKFVGEIEQIPPIYSALKVAGKPLYSYARNEQEVNIVSRKVNIYSIAVLGFDVSKQIALIKVVCGAGTYIRSLAHDIGQDLSCGGYLSALKRAKCNDFALDDAITLARLESLSPELKQQQLLGIDVLVNHLPSYMISAQQYTYLRHGHSATYLDTGTSSSLVSTNPSDIASQKFRLYYNDNFIGVGVIKDNTLIPARLISTSYLLAL